MPPLLVCKPWPWTTDVQLLIDNGVDLESRDRGDMDRTPLLQAVARGHVSVVSLLLRNKANVAVADAFVLVPLPCDSRQH